MSEHEEGQTTAVAQDTAESGGLPVTETAGDNGQSVHAETAEGGSLKPKSPEDWEGRFKSYQSATDKRLAAMKQIEDTFSPFGGYESASKLLMGIVQDNDAMNYLRTRNNPKQADGQEADPEYQQAMQAVRKIVADELSGINPVLQQVVPMIQKAHTDKIENLFSQMDTQHEGWRELRGEMAEGLKNLNPEILNNPSVELLTDLYHSALRKSGKFDEVMQRRYEKMVADKKAKSQELPGRSAQGSRPRPSSMSDALKNAMGDMGISSFRDLK